MSKEHYIQFYNWHKEYKEKINEHFPINCNNRYFIPEITNILHNKEVFVDAGAYDGRVSLKFVNITNNQYDSVHCFEPDKHNFNLLKQNTRKIKRLYRHNIILGKKNGKIGFNFNYGYMSNVKKTGQKFDIIKLDSLTIKPTIIKYHLEGYELEAIKGSKEIIEKYRPIIITTAYHTKDGIAKLPLYLINKLRDYSLLWRNHNYMGQGAVIYCIPKERLGNK